MTSRAQQATRRGFLASLAAGAGVFGVGRASAAIADYEDAKPDHVSITFDEATLAGYQPSLDFPSEMNIRPAALYAWTSTSPEWQYDAHTFIYYYQTQDTDVAVTSHRHDREIVQVFTHPTYGEVREAVYSAGHWAAFRDEEPNVYEADDGGEHVKLAVHPKYRHYTKTSEVGATDIALEPLGTDETLYSGEATQFEVFLQNGWDGVLRPGLLQAADRARFVEHYWADGASRWDQFAASNASWLADSMVAPILAPELAGSDYGD